MYAYYSDCMILRSDVCIKMISEWILIVEGLGQIYSFDEVVYKLKILYLVPKIIKVTEKLTKGAQRQKINLINLFWQV